MAATASLISPATDQEPGWQTVLFTPAGRWHLGLLMLLSLLCAAIYIPTLRANFDFSDDGATAHPVGVQSVAEFNRLVWKTTYIEFAERAPYRPVAWYFWIGQQELFHGDAFLWRCFRLLWTALSAAALIWCLQELGFGPWIALLTTILAIWNPYREEVWLSLTFCEGIAMPFSLGALVCAYRAARSPRAWLWDIGAIVCALLAIGCKNVFAVVVPAQIFLRVCEPGLTLRAGMRRHGLRALMLGVVLAFPIAHFICYRQMTAHEHRYNIGFTWQQPLDMLNALVSSAGKDFISPAIVVALIAWWWSSRGRVDEQGSSFLVQHRAALGAGLILFVLGWGVYAPLGGVSGRYALPGVWGLDLLLAVVLAKLSLLRSPLQKLSWALLACGIIATAVANVGKQEKNTVRLATLWEALHFVEDKAPEGSCVHWVGVLNRGNAETLECGEGVHFSWHLQGLGRRDLRWQIDELPDSTAPVAAPEVAITSTPAPPDSDSWTLAKECRHAYRFRRRAVACYVWQRPQ
jgi:hypothetical protein